MKILLGITGSIEAVLGWKLVRAFDGDEVRVSVTQSAMKFTDFPGIRIISESIATRWEKLGDPILHIELRDWMDALVVAPASANTIAKMANGISDNLITLVWMGSGGKPVIIAPAMEKITWEHPAVQANVQRLKTMGVTIVDPVFSDTPYETMSPISEVVRISRQTVQSYRALKTVTL